MSRHTLAALCALAAACAACSPDAPIDNGAATTCAAGTPDNDASAVCADVQLPNGTTVAAPPIDGYENAVDSAVAANAS